MPTLYSITHRISTAETLFFHAARVTEGNVGAWQALAGCQKGVANIGVYGFIPSLKYFAVAEVWVAYISDTKHTDPNAVIAGSIEMFVTTTTSVHSPFISNMGITRSTSYTGNKHSSIAPQLHSFAAKLMLHLHQEKLYMIHNPAEQMRAIMIELYYKNTLAKHLYIGDERAGYDKAKYCNYEYDDPTLNEDQRDYNAETHKTLSGSYRNDQDNLLLTIQLRQQKAVHGDEFPPL